MLGGRSLLLLALSAFVLETSAATPHVYTPRAKRSASTCSPLELIIARGTNEASSPSYGSIVGDPLYEATADLVGSVTAYAVNYPASFDCDSRQIGADDVLAHIQAQAALCPNQKFALVGYQQGADVIRMAAKKIPRSMYNAISSIVQFSDATNRGYGQPDPLGGYNPGPFPWLLQGRVKENCAYNDPFCTYYGVDLAAHSSYSAKGSPFIKNSARYIEQQFETGGEVGLDRKDNAAGGSETLANIVAWKAIAKNLGQTPAQALTTCPFEEPEPFVMDAPAAPALVAQPVIQRRQASSMASGSVAPSMPSSMPPVVSSMAPMGSYTMGGCSAATVTVTVTAPGSCSFTYVPMSFPSMQSSFPTVQPSMMGSGAASGAGGYGSGSWSMYSMPTIMPSSGGSGSGSGSAGSSGSSNGAGGSPMTTASGSMPSSGSGSGSSISGSGMSMMSGSGMMSGSMISGSMISGSNTASGSGTVAGGATPMSYSTGVVGGATSTPSKGAAVRNMKIGW